VLLVDVFTGIVGLVGVLLALVEPVGVVLGVLGGSLRIIGQTQAISAVSYRETYLILGLVDLAVADA